MSDIFQEVEEDLRRERLKKAWDRYGIFVILTAVLIVAITAGYRGYEAWQTSRARAGGDAFSAVLAAAETTPAETAAAELLGIAGDVPGGYAMLARFRAATAYAAAGDDAQAEKVFAALSTDSEIAQVYRDLAQVRLAQTRLDAEDYAGAEQAAVTIAENAANPFSYAAQEVMGLAAYGRGDRAEAERWFNALQDGASVPRDVAQRARLMLALLAQTRSGAPAASAEETN